MKYKKIIMIARETDKCNFSQPWVLLFSSRQQMFPKIQLRCFIALQYTHFVSPNQTISLSIWLYSYPSLDAVIVAHFHDCSKDWMNSKAKEIATEGHFWRRLGIAS